MSTDDEKDARNHQRVVAFNGTWLRSHFPGPAWCGRRHYPKPSGDSQFEKKEKRGGLLWRP